MQINDRKEQFNFLKSLDIANINAEVENLHPSTHEFWENSTIKKEFIDFLKAFSRNKQAYTKQTLREVDIYAEECFRGENELIEVGFVDGLFEMYKLREAIAKAKAEILSNELMSSYTHRFGTALFTSNITFRSSSIENIIMDKRIELDKEKKIEASLLIYDYLIMQHAGLKLVLEKSTIY